MDGNFPNWQFFILNSPFATHLSPFLISHSPLAISYFLNFSFSFSFALSFFPFSIPHSSFDIPHFPFLISHSLPRCLFPSPNFLFPGPCLLFFIPCSLSPVLSPLFPVRWSRFSPGAVLQPRFQGLIIILLFHSSGRQSIRVDGLLQSTVHVQTANGVTLLRDTRKIFLFPSFNRQPKNARFTTISES